MKLWKTFWKEEDGLYVLEVAVITAILLCLALAFRQKIVEFAKQIADRVLGNG